MHQLTLRPRLSEVFRMIPEGTRLLDIGTDHARLPCALVQQKKIPCAIATDIGEGPLLRAQHTVFTTQTYDKVQLLKRDGLKNIEACMAETISITGMGGETISEILSEADWTKSKVLILQPTTRAEWLRKYLEQTGYSVMTESVVEDENRFYQTLVCKEGKQKYSHPIQYYIGENLKNSSCYERFLDWIQSRFETALQQLARSSEDEEEKIRKFEQLLEGLKIYR